MTIRMDTPIRNPEEDVLGRAKLAESFSEQLLSLDASEGLVTGALGPWGFRKNVLRQSGSSAPEKSGIEILDFNPWMFSGTEQLVESFFVELSAQLRGRDRCRFYELGKSLTRYGEIFSGMRWGWLPVAGLWIDRVRLAIKTSYKSTRSQEGGNRRAQGQGQEGPYCSRDATRRRCR